MRSAELIEERMPLLIGLLVREAGKSVPNAIAEVRETVDFLRYYGAQVRDEFEEGTYLALGVVVCISPWNFPLAIFIGQIGAALAVGNVVLAKPAEETPLVAAQAVAILHEAGVPEKALQLLPGGGDVGAMLVADVRTNGVIFTGSGEVSRLVQRSLAARQNPDGHPVPLIAETGGQNALVVDSSALSEQVVADVLTSAFDSAGQRCSALRVLCVQDDVADKTLAMLKGALAEMTLGNPDRFRVDIGPVISEDARGTVAAHVERLRDQGCRVFQGELPAACEHGVFVAPTIIEIADLACLTKECFGPVLHVVRFAHDQLDDLLSAVNATGYGLTFGIHSRIGDTVALATARANAGNIYVNRDMVGAVVGVQPFGGCGLSGTGPKAGGPLYLRRLLARRPPCRGPANGPVAPGVEAWRSWLGSCGCGLAASTEYPPLAGTEWTLPGPVGEENLYRLRARGAVLCVADGRDALIRQVGAALSTGNKALVPSDGFRGLPTLPRTLAPLVEPVEDRSSCAFDAVLFDASPAALLELAAELARRPGPIIQIHMPDHHRRYPVEWLIMERSICTNTTAAGGNADLMMID